MAHQAMERTHANQQCIVQVGKVAVVQGVYVPTQKQSLSSTGMHACSLLLRLCQSVRSMMTQFLEFLLVAGIFQQSSRYKKIEFPAFDKHNLLSF